MHTRRRCHLGGGDHFLGARPRQPEFRINGDPSVQVRTQVDDSQATITSGALTARFSRGERWTLEFLANDIVLTASAGKAMALITSSGRPTFASSSV